MSWGRRDANRSLNLTDQTQKFLDGLARERGLSKRAVDDVNRSIQRGTSSWVDVMSNRGCNPKAGKKPRVHFGPRVAVAGTPQRWAGKKMRGEILRDNPPERDQFHGGSVCMDREAEKDKLIRKFAYGRQGAAEVETAHHQEGEKKRAMETRPAEEQLIDQIIDEIEERRSFLECMSKRGCGNDYESQIKLEIASRLAELKGLGMKM